MTSWAQYERMSRGFRALCDKINGMNPGQRVSITLDEIVTLYAYNDWIYGSGFEGLKRAIRGNVMGSSFGTVHFVPQIDPGLLVIEKREPGERVFDRDGEPT